MRLISTSHLAEAVGVPLSLLSQWVRRGILSAGDQGLVWRVADPGGGWQEITLPVKDAGQHVGHVFRWLVLAQGIDLSAPERGIAPAEAHLLAVHESAPLRHLLTEMLVHSSNMMAETIGLSAAQRLGGGASGLDAAGALLLAHLGRLMPDSRTASRDRGAATSGSAADVPRSALSSATSACAAGCVAGGNAASARAGGSRKR